MNPPVAQRPWEPNVLDNLSGDALAHEIENGEREVERLRALIAAGHTDDPLWESDSPEIE